MPTVIHRVGKTWRVYGPWGFRTFPEVESRFELYQTLREELRLPSITENKEVVMALTTKSWERGRWVDDFTYRLKELRQSSGLSQTELAERALMSVQAIAALEQGARLPGFGTARKLAEALGVSIDAFTYLTEAELARLPRWARVAFAVRCVHVALVAAPEFWPGPQPEIRIALKRAVEFARRSAEHAQPDAELEEAVRQADRYARGSAGLAQVRSPGSAPSEVPRSDTIRYAVANACAAVGRTALNSSLEDARSAYSFAQMACRAVGGHDDHLIAMLHEYEALRAIANRENWDDSTPVPVQIPAGYESQLT